MWVCEYVCICLFGRHIFGSVFEVLFVFEETCLSLRLQSESLISGNSLLPGLTFTPLFSQRVGRLRIGDWLPETCWASPVTTPPPPLQCLSRPRSEWILSWSLDQTLASGSQRSSKQLAGLIFVRAPLRNRLGFTTQRIASWVSDPSAAVARPGAGKAALIFSFPMKLKARETRVSRWHIYFRHVLRPRKLSLVGHAAPQCGRRRGACVGVLWLKLFFGLEGNSLSTRIMSLGGWFISRGPGNGIRVLRLFTFLTVPSCSVAGGFSTLQRHGEPYL